MTERTPAPAEDLRVSRTGRHVLFAGVALVLVAGLSVWLVLHSEIFWRWAGEKIVATLNDRLQGELTVQRIEGTPFQGYTFRDLRLCAPAGEVFRAKGLMLRLSLWSLVRLAPVVDKIALYEPHLTLEQDRGGSWNVSRLWLPQTGQTSEFPLPLRSLTFSQISFQGGQIRVMQPGSDRHFADIDLGLSLTVVAPLAAEWRLEVGGARLAAATPWGRLALETRLTYTQRQLDLASLLLTSQGDRLLSLAGDLVLDGSRSSSLTGDIGPLPGTLLARFVGAWPSSWQAGGSVQVQGQPADFQFHLRGKVGEADVNLNGRVAPWQDVPTYDVTLALAAISPALLAVLEIPGTEVYGGMSPVSLRLHLRGAGLTWPPPKFSWQLQADPFTLGPAKVAQLTLGVAGNADRQELSGEVAGNFGRAHLASRGALFTLPRGDIKLRLQDFQPALLGFRELADTALTADFDGDFHAPGFTRMADLHLGGCLQASGRLRGAPLQNFLARFVWAPPRLVLDEVRVQMGNVAASGRGVLDGNRLDFTHQGRMLPGGDWPAPATLKGDVTWRGAIQGTTAEPDYSLHAQGRGLTLATIGIKAFTLRAQGSGLPPGNGVLELKADDVKTPAGTFHELRLRANGTGQRWCYRFWAASPPSGPRAAVFGNIDLGSRPLFLVVSHLDLHLQGLRLKNQNPLQARLFPGLDLPPAALTLNGGTMEVAARWQGDQVKASLALRNLPLELARVPGLRGRLQSHLTLSGTTRQPLLEGSLSLTTLAYNQYAFHSIDTVFSLREGVARIAGKALETPGGVQFAWEGSQPLQVSLQPYRLDLPDSGLDFSLQSTGGNLKVLEKLVPEIAKADIPLDLHLRLRGNWRQPEVEAGVHWQQGSLTLHQAGIPYHVAPGALIWQGNKLSLPQLTLESGGTLRLAGVADFQGYLPRNVKLRAEIDNFKLLDRLASEAIINGSADLTGPFEAMRLLGQFTIPRAIVNPALVRPLTRPHPDIVLVRQKQPGKPKPEKTPQPQAAFYRNLTIDLSLEAPNNLWVRQKTPQVGANVELSAAIRASQRPGEALTLAGQVRALEGSLSIFNKDFNVDKAVVTLPGPAVQQPFIEARLSHEMADATLLVDVSGPVNRPQIDLSSSPPLSPNDLMSYLLFNRPAGALSQEEFDAGQQAAGVLGGMTASKIQELLGDDFPILGDVTVKGSAGGIGLTKDLAKGVRISLERRTGPTAKEDPSTVRLEYRLNRFLKLQAEQSQRNTGGDILFKYDF